MAAPIDQLDLWLGDRLIGRLLYRHSDETYGVELSSDFLQSGHEIAPLVAPHLDAFRSGVVECRERPDPTSPFPGGLPGLIADSLPDDWGRQIAAIEEPQGAKSIMELLARVGADGLGAISYRIPGAESKRPELAEESLSKVAAAAEEIAAKRFHRRRVGRPLTPSLLTGGTLGGMFPKSAIHLPLRMREGGVLSSPKIRSGGPVPEGALPAIVKFSPVPDDEAAGSVEYAFYEMAKAAGLRLPAACLLDDGAGGRHFAVERFDRLLNQGGLVRRLHVQTLCGLLHRRAVGEITYRDLMDVAATLGGAPEAVEAYRRIVFNLLATNRDDHGRNHAFLYDPESRRWSLAPAYDLNPSLVETLDALRWGSGTGLPAKFREVLAFATDAGIPRETAVRVFREVASATLRWPEFAQAASVPEHIAKTWGDGILSTTKQGGPLRADFDLFESKGLPGIAGPVAPARARPKVAIQKASLADPDPLLEGRKHSQPLPRRERPLRLS